jgi:glycosyltransferase involved in cell wall biosynthesis
MEKAVISVIIPAYNEGALIGKVVMELKDAIGHAQVVVIDDGSEDDTAVQAAKAGAEVISHPVNLGNGASVKTGIRAAGGDLVVIMDGDGQHDPAEISKLLEHIDLYDMVVGARAGKQHASWPRRIMNRIFSRLAAYVTSYPVEDLTSGFRALRSDTARDLLPLLPNGYSWPTTSTLVLLRSGLSVKYVPIDVHPRRYGRSRIRPVYDSIRFLMIILKICTLYSPFRIFLPTSGAMFLVGLLNYAYTYVTSSRFTNMSALMFTGAIILFMMGLISEQISQISLLRHQVKRRYSNMLRSKPQRSDDHQN